MSQLSGQASIPSGVEELVRDFPPEPITSDEFARLAAEGRSNEAISRLGRNRIARVFNAIRRSFGPSIVEDAVQDGIAELWRAAARFDPRYDLERCLFENAKRAALRMIRRRNEDLGRVHFVLRDRPRPMLEDELCVEPDHLAGLCAQELERLLRTSLDGLTDDRRKDVAELFVSHFLEFGRPPTVEQVAHHCRISGRQARRRLSHVRKHLARLLSRTSRRQP